MSLSKTLQAYRARTFRILPDLRLSTPEAAVDFVNERGFIFFWPISEITFPSLWNAVAGDRPVPDAHDDPGHITWSWKDSLLGKKRWYYTRLLRKRNTIISLQTIPYFYALSPNYGSPEADYLEDYENGLMTVEARQVYEALLRKGPLDTIALRREAHLSSSESDGRFNKALTDLQVSLRILPVGVAEVGAWNYAFLYEVVHRHVPEIIEQARFIQENQARLVLTRLFFKAVGWAQERNVLRLFGWPHPVVHQVLDEMVQKGELRPGIELPGQAGEGYMLPSLE
jgi:Winged helix DNA-binding domain